MVILYILLNYVDRDIPTLSLGPGPSNGPKEKQNSAIKI